MPRIVQVRISGFGGQGVVLAGMLLGQAGVFEGSFVSGSNSYGAQARGSGCRSEILLSDGPIDFPHVTTADVLISMSQSAFDVYHEEVRAQSGVIVYDQGQVKPKESRSVRLIGLPATERAIGKLGTKQVSNIILLGALVGATRIVSPNAVRRAIRLHVGERFNALNLQAFRLGVELGKKANG